MAVVVGTVFLLLALDPNSLRVFLTLVAVFSGYLAFSGYRVLGRKRPADEPAVNWVAARAVVLACLGLDGWGAATLFDGATFGVVMVVFGGIRLTFGGTDVRTFQGDRNRGGWSHTSSGC